MGLSDPLEQCDPVRFNMLRLEETLAMGPEEEEETTAAATGSEEAAASSVSSWTVDVEGGEHEV